MLTLQVVKWLGQWVDVRVVAGVLIDVVLIVFVLNLGRTSQLWASVEALKKRGE